MHHIALKRSEDILEKSQEDLRLESSDRRYFSSFRKKKLTDEEKDFKTDLKREESRFRSLKDELEMKVTDVKKKHNSSVMQLKFSDDKHGKVCCIKNHIERHTLRRHKIIGVTHCGGKFQGNAIRRLMKNGDVAYDSASNYLNNLNNNNKIGNHNDDISTNEVVTVCKYYGNLFFLF